MKNTTILAVNGGSSSLKCALYSGSAGAMALHRSFSVQNIFAQPHLKIQDEDGGVVDDLALHLESNRAIHAQCLQHILSWIREHGDLAVIRAVGHRVVHGGDYFSGPVIVDKRCLEQLHDLSPLAPLHQPVNVNLIEASQSMLPDVPQIASFDTSFHQSQSPIERAYALPESITAAGVQAFGFHGLSYEYVMGVLQMLDEHTRDQKIIIAHLGAGASLAAITDGRSVATTMGFSTADGLPMATRCGSIDPGVLIYLIRQLDMDANDLEELLYTRSGLLGMSGISGDMVTLRKSTDPRAGSAIDYFIYRIVREMGALIAVLGGLDTLVFTGGIGENDIQLRCDVVTALQWLGIKLNEQANHDGHNVISSADSSVTVRVIPTDEQAQIVQHTMRVLERL